MELRRKCKAILGLCWVARKTAASGQEASVFILQAWAVHIPHLCPGPPIYQTGPGRQS